MTKGFHVCKPGNAPTVGQTKSLIVSGDRIKSKKAEEGGQNYIIRSAIQRDSYSDSYGNVGYDIEIEPAGVGTQSTQAAPQRADGGNGNDDRSNRIERQHSQEMAVRWITLLTTLGVLKPEDISTPKKLRECIDFFQRDISRQPLSPVEAEAKAMFNATEAGDGEVF